MKVFHVNVKMNRDRVLAKFPKAQPCGSCLSISECSTISVEDGKVAISFVYPGYVSILRSNTVEDAKKVAATLGFDIIEVAEENLDQAFESQLSVAVGRLLRCYAPPYV